MNEKLSGPESVELRWRTGAIGCLLPVMVGVCVLFGFAAFDASIVDKLVEGRRGEIFSITRQATVVGINIPVLFLALYLAWEVFRFAWRWADEIAVKATSVGLVPHRSTLMKPLRWSEVSDVSFAIIRRAPSLVIKLRDESTRTIRGVENENGAAEEFATFAREKAAFH